MARRPRISRLAHAATVIASLTLPAAVLALGFHDVEPDNDTAAGAGPVALTAGGAALGYGFLDAGDVDFYRVTLPAQGHLWVATASLSGLPANFDDPQTRVGIFDTDGTSLLVENLGAPSDNLTNQGGNGVRFVAAASGDYFVAVTGGADASYGGSHASVGRYAVSLSLNSATDLATDETDDAGNDVRAGAQPLGLAAGDALRLLARLRHVAAGDVDFFSVALATDDVLVASTTPLGDAIEIPDTRLGILDGSGSVLVTDDDDGGGNLPGGSYASTVRYRATAPGTFYVAVANYDDTGFDGGDAVEAGEYALTVGVVAGAAAPTLDTDPVNDVRTGADALTLDGGGAALVVATMAAGSTSDVDFFSIALQRSQVLTATSAQLDAAHRLAIFDAGAATPLVDNLAAGTGAPGATVRLRAPATGTYYLAVADPDDAGYTGTTTTPVAGTYALQVSAQSPLPAGAATLDTDPSNDVRAGADASALGAASARLVRANLVPGFDVDFYSVSLRAGETLLACTTPLRGIFDVPDTRLGIFDAGGTLLTDNRFNGSDLPNAYDNAALTRLYAPADGTYFVAVANDEDATYDGSGDDDSGPYALTLARVPPMIFEDGFESEDTSRWTGTVPP